MSVQLYLVFILLGFALDFSDCRSKNSKSYRDIRDYTYLEKTGSYYKYHCEEESWRTADKYCKLDGALLYYPENEAELEEVERVIVDGSKIWIGVSKQAGSFQTVDGRNTSDIFMPWAWDEPKKYNVWGESCECVTLSYKSYKLMSSEPCAVHQGHPKSFVCKYTPQDNEVDIDSEVEIVETTTEIINENPPLLKEYKYLENTTSFYKFYKPAVSWYEAVELCKSDGAQLFYPENEEEANDVAKLLGIWEIVVIIPVWIGISKINSSLGFETIDGRPISEVYNRWNPFNLHIYDNYNCIQLDNLYFLYEFDCDQPRRVVCKYSQKNNQVDGKEIDTITTTSKTVDDKSQGGVDCSSPTGQDESKSHIYFGKVVADEISQFPNKEKLQIMTSILKVLREQWGTKPAAGDVIPQAKH